MMYRTKPHFIIKKDLQKSEQTGHYFDEAVTPQVLSDVCRRITGLIDYTYDYVDKNYQDEFLKPTYNQGRMAIMQYQDWVAYISFSEVEVGGRNSSVQSVPTAFNMYYSNPYPHKRLFYYFLNTSDSVATDYQILIYRLMNTIGFEFLNTPIDLSMRIQAFTSVEDIIFNRRINAGRNRSNNSTFITKNRANEIEVYGKTYGANKYETSLICYALSELWQEGQHITLYEVLEKDLKELPKSSLDVIEDMGIVDVIPTNTTLEKKIFNESNSLRSPRYLYNLFSKLGNKHCALCRCEIPELIQGAHIWPVSDIKRANHLSFDEKLACAIDGDNGLWLCENHHKMFDEHLLTFNENGGVMFNDNIERRHRRFIDDTTIFTELPEFILTDKFQEYLWLRNRAV